MDTKILQVELGDRAYPIHIGTGMLQEGSLLSAFIPQKKVWVVTNTTIAPLYLNTLQKGLEHAGIDVLSVILPDGEQHKNWQTLQLIFDALIEAHAERQSTLIALGGGVVGDIGGFAAACYQRGMPFIQIPTTLLAQVDSSVGGKTAINHPQGKNMIGAFYQPQLVLADIDTLATLPDRELKSGFAEVIKYGLIGDQPFFVWLENNIERLLAREADALIYAIQQSCQNKAAIVARDEKEAGDRALLNFGHTFGHAIETGMGYGQWLHGEAVSAGMVMAASLSYRRGLLQKDAFDRCKNLLARAGLPVVGAKMPPDRYIELMRHDKKVSNKQLRLILLEDLGAATIEDSVPESEIAGAIQSCLLN